MWIERKKTDHIASCSQFSNCTFLRHCFIWNTRSNWDTILLITLWAPGDCLLESILRNLQMGNGRHHKSAGSLPIFFFKGRKCLFSLWDWLTTLWTEVSRLGQGSGEWSEQKGVVVPAQRTSSWQGGQVWFQQRAFALPAKKMGLIR